MTEFIIGSEGYKKVKKELFVKTGIMMLIVVVAGSCIVGFQPDGLQTLIFMVPFFVLIMGYSMYRSMARQKSAFESYRLIIDGDTITRQILNTRDIRLRFDEITDIEKTSKGSFVVKTNSNTNTIYVFSQVQNIGALENILATIRPLTLKQAAFYSKYLSYAIIIIVLAAMVTVYTSTNKLVVGVSAAILICMMCWGFYVMQTNKNVNTKSKNLSWLVIIVILSVAAIVYYKLVA